MIPKREGKSQRIADMKEEEGRIKFVSVHLKLRLSLQSRLSYDMRRVSQFHPFSHTRLLLLLRDNQNEQQTIKYYAHDDDDPFGEENYSDDVHIARTRGKIINFD